MFLDRIVATKQKEIEALKERVQRSELEKHIAQLPPCRGFERALTLQKKRDMGLIAEVKKASPSKGLIRDDFDPVTLARAYESAGADCISVLTDVDYFQGAAEYLTRVHEAVSLPLLRKDFILDPMQILEARVIGADAILLIAAILTKEQIVTFADLASSLGMDVLVEVHNATELENVLTTSASLIGINNRNLHTFVTDLNTTDELCKMIPSDKTIVSESGIAHPQDVQRLKQAGAEALLIGEHFMRQPDVAQAVNELMGVCQ